LCAQFDEDCWAAVNNTQCVEGRCRCAYDYVWSVNTTDCRYDGGDTRLNIVGVTLIVVIVVVSSLDILLISGLVIALIVLRRRRHESRT